MTMTINTIILNIKTHCALNLCGFISKLELGVFDQFILTSSYYIVCLSETKRKSIDNNYLSGFSIYDHPKVGIHGNSILIRNT